MLHNLCYIQFFLFWRTDFWISCKNTFSVKIILVRTMRRIKSKHSFSFNNSLRRNTVFFKSNLKKEIKIHWSQILTNPENTFYFITLCLPLLFYSTSIALFNKISQRYEKVSILMQATIMHYQQFFRVKKT